MADLIMERSLENINLSEIESENLKYIITYGYDLTDLTQSIKNVGIVNPPIVIKEKEKYHIVCGFKRLLVLKELGYTEVKAVILPSITDNKTCVKIMLNDNFVVRSFNFIEKVHLVKLLDINCFEKRIIDEFINELGLRKFGKDKIEKIHCASPQIKLAVASGIITPKIAMELIYFNKNDQDSFLSIFNSLEFGKNKQEIFFEHVMDVSIRDNVSISEILNSQVINNILSNETITSPQKISEIRSYVENMRFPKITAFKNKYRELQNSLKIDKGISIVPYSLEEDNLHKVSFEFNSTESMGEKINSLLKIVESEPFNIMMNL